jgi:hypothetical protein
MTCSFNRVESDGPSLGALGVRRRNLGANLANILSVIFVTTYSSVRVDAAARSRSRAITVLSLLNSTRVGVGIQFAGAAARSRIQTLNTP